MEDYLVRLSTQEGDDPDISAHVPMQEKCWTQKRKSSFATTANRRCTPPSKRGHMSTPVLIIRTLYLKQVWMRTLNMHVFKLAIGWKIFGS